MTPINPLYKLFAAGVGALVVLVLLLPGVGREFSAGAQRAGTKRSLFLYCAAAVRQPVELIALRYREEYGIQVNIQYGGSNTLLGQIEVARQGDLYLAADESYLAIAQEKQLVLDVIPLAQMTPVVGVPRGNPKAVRTLGDLLALRISAGNPDQSAIGNATRRLLTAAGQWQALDAQVRRHGVYKPTVGDVANDVLLGSVDAGIMWDAVANQHPGIDVVSVPELSAGAAKLGIGVLNGCRNPKGARHFAQYLAASDRGLLAFKETGYQPVDGTPWNAFLTANPGLQP